MAKSKKLPPLGHKFGKPDIERLGIFIEDSYMNGKKYVSPFPKPAAFKGRNMLPEGRKSKCGTQHGYFDDKFRRLFEGEAINWKKQKQKSKTKENPVFIPTGPGKWHSSPGDHYGCFSGNIEHFSNARKATEKYKKQKPNILSSPGKMGGPGYADICLSKYPQHMKDPYNPKEKFKPRKGPPMITTIYPQPYFDRNPFGDSKGKPGSTYVRPKVEKSKIRAIWIPNGPCKWQGGMHDGCINPFPKWETDRKKQDKSAGKSKKWGVMYPPSWGLKSLYTAPILHKQTDASINLQNYTTYEPNYVKNLLD